MDDYARTREVYGIDLPPDSAGRDAVIDYVAQLYGFPTSTAIEQGEGVLIGHSYPPLQSGIKTNEWAEIFLDSHAPYLAFDQRHVDQSVRTGAEPKTLVVLMGRFDPAATDSALVACGECPSPERVTYRGVPYYRWGPDFEIGGELRLSPPVFDQYGLGGRWAIRDHAVLRTVHTLGIEMAIDASLGHRNLGQDVNFRLLAQGLHELGVHAAFMTDETQGGTAREAVIGMIGRFTGSVNGRPGDIDRLEGLLLEQGPQMKRYLAAATGLGRDARGDFTAIVLVHAGADAAEENIGLLRARIRDASSLYSGDSYSLLFEEVEIRSEGRVLLAKLYGEDTRFFLQFWGQGDPFLWHD